MTQYISCVETIQTILAFMQNKRPGMYLRYGDGDFNIASGKDDMLAISTPTLQHWMQESMKISNEHVMTCIPHHCKKIGTLEEGMYGGNHEYPLSMVEEFINVLRTIRHVTPIILYTNVALSYCSSHHPDLVIQMHKEIKKNNVLYIGNDMYSTEFLNKLFGLLDRIHTPQRDSYAEHDRIFAEFDTLYETKYKGLDYFIVIMAAGCGGRAISGELYSIYFKNNPNFFIFDYGSLLDCLWGYQSRAYMELDPPKTSYILDSI